MERLPACVVEERRRLTASCLNIVAAGLVSAGAVPFFAVLATDGWAGRTPGLALVALGSQSLSVVLHLLGRSLIRHPLHPGGPVRLESMGPLERELCLADQPGGSVDESPRRGPAVREEGRQAQAVLQSVTGQAGPRMSARAGK